MKYLATLAASLIAGATVVSAHGNVNHTVIDNILYDGFNVDYPHHPKIFRSLAGIGPVCCLSSHSHITTQRCLADGILRWLIYSLLTSNVEVIHQLANLPVPQLPLLPL